MAYEPIYDVAACECKRNVCYGQVVVEAKLVPPTTVAIAKVLVVHAVAYVTDCDVFVGEARVNGKVDFKVLFLGEDKLCHSMDYSAMFTDKVNDDAITQSDCYVTGKVLDTDVVNVGADSIRLASVVELAVVDNSVTRMKYLARTGEGIMAHETTIEKSHLEGTYRDTTTLDQRISGGDVLLTLPRVCISACRAGLDEIHTEGEIVCDVIAAEGDALRCYHVSTPFEVETSADVDNSAIILPRATVTATYDIVGEEERECELHYELNLVLSAYTNHSLTVCDDAFSLDRVLKTDRQCSHVGTVKAYVPMSDRVDGVVTLADDMPALDTVIGAAGGTLTVSNAFVSEGKITIEGIVAATVLYYSAELSTYSSVEVELPFSISRKFEVESTDKISVCGCVQGINVKVRKIGELDIRADVAFGIEVCSQRSVDVIENLEVCEDKAKPTGVLGIHVVKVGESWWDVAKALNAPIEVLREQNGMDAELSGGERIMIYRHLDR